ATCDLTEPRLFNLMFKTFMGPVEEQAAVVYLRPETAQGIYVNFENVRVASRQKIPFGIAQIGKAFRNEITPGNFIFRTREFEQMEMQFFVHPESANQWFEHWKEQRIGFYDAIGIRKEKLRFHEHGEGELAHYAKAAFDIEYEFPFGWQELEGIHNRGDFDLNRHQEYSGKKLEYFDESTREKYVPWVIETSAGCDRTLLTCLIDAYREDEHEGESRTFLSLHPRLAPIKAAIFPLVKRDGMPEIAEKITQELRPRMDVFYEEKNTIGKRYRRMDEVGTPYCVTVDSETLSNDSVTVRSRDTLEQKRVNLSELRGFLEEKIWQ
ncbi:MAG: glycine--tRNA ligase, partial [Candidatus Eisenbacteria bacterium]|nr:glycine--tRNA ligase [Candidatus Eisenbacteria bacterium]